MRRLSELDVAGKTVLLRTDYNVPIKDGKVHDDFRIKASLPTIRYMLDKQCRIIIVSHLGRPEGKAVAEYSLRPVAQRLADLVRHKVQFAQDVAAAQKLDGQIVVLENLRFDKREVTNDAGFAKELAGLADCYVDDAFAAIHRAHASIVAVAKLLPSAAGLLVEQEVEQLHKAIDDPAQPLLAIIGGAKVADKIDLIEQLITKAKTIVVGGAMANTFLASQGIAIGASRYEADELAEAKRLLAKARRNNVQVILPSDVVVATELSEGAEARTINLSDVAANDIIADIGPLTVKKAASLLKQGGTVIWNGPLGVEEFPQFAKATLRLARAIAASKVFSVIGGGDTTDVLDRAGLHNKMSFVSTGGGAALELLAGKELPGLKVLSAEVTSKPINHAVPSAPMRPDNPKTLLVANWKANTTLRQAIALAEASNALAKQHHNLELVICPPAPYLSLLRHGLGHLYMDFGVQDISAYEVGTHTGDVPASIAAQLASFAIVGHSERRAQHHESDNVVASKATRAVQAGLQAIICVGDRLVDKQHHHAQRRVTDQLEVALKNITAAELDHIIIAYEPVWAISSGDGRGTFALPRDVERMVAHIQLVIKSRYGEVANKVRVLYGGRVNKDNAQAYLALSGIDGLLIGGASLDIYQMRSIGEAPGRLS